MSFVKKVFLTIMVSIIFIGLASGYSIYADDPTPTPIQITENDLVKVGAMDVSLLESLIDETGTYLQNFSRYGNSNIYFFSADRGGNTYIIRCSLSSLVFSPIDYVILENFGHGESLEVTAYDSATNTYTLWVGTDKHDVYEWSTHIARIKYEVNSLEESGAVVDDTKTKTITGLIDAATGSTGASEHRSTVCVTSVSDDRICFSTRKKVNNIKGVYNLIYDLSDVNNALDALTDSTVSLGSFSAYQKSVFWMPLEEAYPENSYQGEDISGVGTGNKMIYFAGGKTDQDSNIFKYKYTNANNYLLQAKYLVKTTTVSNDSLIYKGELEGIKIYQESSHDYMYLMYRKKGGTQYFTVFKYQE